MAALGATEGAEHYENTPQNPQAQSRALSRRATPTMNRRKLAQKTFLETLGRGFTVTRAAKAAGVDRKTPYLWRDKDPKFAEAWDEADASGFDTVEDFIRMAAPKDWRAAAALLDARASGGWGAKRKAMLNVNIDNQVNGAPAPKTDDRFEQILATVTALDDDSDPPPRFKALTMIDRNAQDAVEVTPGDASTQ